MLALLKNKKLITIILIIILTLSFLVNVFNTDVVTSNFSSFQSDSENLVNGKIYCDKEIPDNPNCRYGLVSYENHPIINILNEDNKDNYQMENYVSQVGLQGYVISFMHNSLKIPIFIIKGLISLSLAIVLYFISYYMSKKYNRLFGIIFYFTFLLSPWVVAFGKNMYWVSFTWFLPFLWGLILSCNYDKKRVYVPLIFLSIVIKCLCGYEYLSVIMMASISLFIVDYFVSKDKIKKKEILKTTILVGIVSVLAFILVLSIHGYMRGNKDILSGIKDIYEKDVLKRTILTFDKDSYEGIMRDSMDASIFQVLKKYIYDWYTDIVLGISGKLFPIMMMVSFGIALYNYKVKQVKEELIMYLIFLITCVSWFVLGKSHSYIHTHMNYVLWYFGFIEVILYILIKNGYDYLKIFMKKTYKEKE